jgi:hypothetical protein
MSSFFKKLLVVLMSIAALVGVQNADAATTSIRLNWSASTDNVGVAGYKVYRNNAEIATVTSGTTYLDSANLQPNTTYTYTVAAYDAAGNVSPRSSAATVTTAGPDPTGTNCSLFDASTALTQGFGSPMNFFTSHAGARIILQRRHGDRPCAQTARHPVPLHLHDRVSVECRGEPMAVVPVYL